MCLLTRSMVGNLHGSILLNPQLTNDDVMYTAIHVTPGVGFPVTVRRGREEGKEGGEGRVGWKGGREGWERKERKEGGKGG